MGNRAFPGNCICDDPSLNRRGLATDTVPLADSLMACLWLSRRATVDVLYKIREFDYFKENYTASKKRNLNRNAKFESEITPLREIFAQPGYCNGVSERLVRFDLRFVRVTENILFREPAIFRPL